MATSVPSVGSVNSNQPLQTSTSSATGLGSLDGNAFLTLLTAQLQNQDPESPQDPATFVDQLTSFSQLEQLIDIHQILQTPSSTSNGSTQNQANGTTPAAQ